MKRFIIITALLAFAFPVFVRAESINSFESDITLKSDGSFDVVETIVYDFGEEERHGIFRTIPTSHTEESDKWFHERVIDIEVQSVSMDGGDVPYEVSRDLGELDIKIGDPDETITEAHTYVIEYQVAGALYYYESGSVDLYWNVTGHDWTVPIEEVTARVHDPEGITLSEFSCYFGAYGEVNECAAESEEETVVFDDVRLSPSEGMTLAQSIDPTKVETLILEEWSLWPVWLALAVLWLIWLGWFLYGYAREHRTGASVIAQYEPYEGLKPMYAGLLFDGRIDPRDITAGIIHLAEQGFFKIKHIGRKVLFFIDTDDYEITLLRPYGELEAEFQKSLFTLLFSEDAKPGASVILSELAKDFSKQTENSKVLVALNKAAEADLTQQGYFKNEWRTPGKIVIGLAVAMLVLLEVAAFIGAGLIMPIVISAGVLFVSIIALLIVYRRRTKKGYQALDHLKGFKEFLSVTDRERFKFHNAPKKSPEQFMEFLPYAIAFGVEKEWAEAFKDITIPEPTWYEGRGTAFNAAYLSHSLGTFSSSVSSASTASTGGGSSGGGAGGGGGGSW